MKHLTFIITVITLSLFSLNSFSESIKKEVVEKAAQSFISAHNSKQIIKSIDLISIDNQDILYMVQLEPCGYIVFSSDSDLPPIIAYSFTNNLDNEGPFYSLLKTDIQLRKNSLSELPATIIIERNKLWLDLIKGKTREKSFEQWPEEGTTPTGGWLESNWTQTAPYYNMCPMDPVTSIRSYVGCPATAMAMILNFHQNINETVFTDEDDYYHSYAGRTYNIDDDYETIGFPSFVDLNKYLDTLQTHWLEETPLTNNDKAALSFACGIAAHQVYTSEGSGTFAVSQARDAYLRFACADIILYEETDEGLFPDLIQDMKDTCPAHLALVDEGWTTGHNVVVDGYNTDNYFHVNFGWGGTNNGWYLLPDEMPYSLTVIEGLIVNILKDEAVFTETQINDNFFSVYPNPAQNTIHILADPNNSDNCNKIEIYNISGQLVKTYPFIPKMSINTEDFGGNGLYFLHIIDKNNNSFYSSKVIVRK